MIFNGRVSSPLAFRAVIVTTYSPGVFSDPVICPVLASSVRPSGICAAEKVIGLSPVAAAVKRNGCPGRTPNTFA